MILIGLIIDLVLGANSKETLKYIVSLLGKKTWYKKSTNRTFSKQGSSGTSWDVVGRELVTLDEISKMPKEYKKKLMKDKTEKNLLEAEDDIKNGRIRDAKDVFEEWNVKYGI